jgi:uncharacterized protein YutE (UPF0331/DUF86 family)
LVDHEVFDRRLGKLEEILRGLRDLAAGTSREDYLEDRRLQAQAERWMHLAAECCLDLANHLIADRGWRSPATYRETFAILKEEGVISADLGKKLEGWAGLRNVLVHLYLAVDHTRIWQFLTEELDDLEAFARAVVEATAD